MTRRSILAGASAFLVPQSAKADSRFSVPPEDARHERTFMQWPVSRKVYRDKVFLRMTQRCIAKIANTISDFEPVVMLVDKAHHPAARRLLSEIVDLWDIPTEDLWCRDAGPLFATNGHELAVHNLNFNGWGRKQVHRADGRIAERVAERLGLRLVDSGVVGEAGGVESDGHGTLMAHESSWVNPNRNRLSRDVIETRLLAAFGAQEMLWAPGIWGEDITDYHIDSLARFVAPGHVLIQLPNNPDPSDIWQTVPYETHDILAATRGVNGNLVKLTVIPDPLKRRVKSPDFVASYANYYVCNGAVIAAQFGDARADRFAADTLADLHPGRSVVTLNVDPLGELGGGIHCATQQQPKLA
ncbi:MAG: agmatine deiminase family protein [Rhodobacteraceae bacterium]|nr:agmatine deiminase family protein [Paracoccaceae bacterium]